MNFQTWKLLQTTEFKITVSMLSNGKIWKKKTNIFLTINHHQINRFDDYTRIPIQKP